MGEPGGVVLVYLKCPPELLKARLLQRAGHFMKAGMLSSQLAALEEPAAEDGVTVESGDASLAEVVAAIEAALGMGARTPRAS